MGQAQPLAGWCWVFSVVHAQMGPCSYIEMRVSRCRTNRRTHHSDMPRTSGTYRNTWTDSFGCRHTMLAEYHHCQHLKMWIPSKRRRRSCLCFAEPVVGVHRSVARIISSSKALHMNQLGDLHASLASRGHCKLPVYP